MKTAISLPDDLFLRADRVAKRLRKSRSALYRDAVTDYVNRHDPDEVTETMDRVLSLVDSGIDPFVKEAGRQALQRSEW